MTQWEYVTIQGNSNQVERNPDEFARQLNAAGWEGWELVSVIHHDNPIPIQQSVTAFLKRAVTEERKQQLAAAPY